MKLVEGSQTLSSSIPSCYDFELWVRHCFGLGSVTNKPVEEGSSRSLTSSDKQVDQVFSDDPHNPGSYLCALCYASVVQRIQHIQVHLGDKIKCPYCGAVSRKLGALFKHANANHGVREKTFSIYLYKILVKNYPDKFKKRKLML